MNARWPPCWAAMRRPAGRCRGRWPLLDRAAPPPALPQSLAAHVADCPPELAARLALVQVAEVDDGRALPPGVWLVTLAGHVRRWDGFVARGEGAAEAARLEADNRFAALEAEVPPLREAATNAEAQTGATAAALAQAQAAALAAEREMAAAAEAERARPARAGCRRGRARAAGHAPRRTGRGRARSGRPARCRAAEHEPRKPAAPRCPCPMWAARCWKPPAPGTRPRARHQAATARLAAQDQALAVARERVPRRRRSATGRRARATPPAARNGRRFAEIEERAPPPPNPPGWSARSPRRAPARGAGCATGRGGSGSGRGHAGGASRRSRWPPRRGAGQRARGPPAAARAENEEQRRTEMNRISGERFQCPPPLLPERFGFTGAEVGAAGENRPWTGCRRSASGSARSIWWPPRNWPRPKRAPRNRPASGPNWPRRCPAARLDRQPEPRGRERLRAAFEAVDGHFRRLFTTLFQGGAAGASGAGRFRRSAGGGLEIFAQPPGKRLQSLTLLSGGEQALTAVALIFALFLTNPSPICVLDEVDAPLDDANIERFCDLLEAMTRRPTRAI
jgi:chromosome segregation protein